MNIAIIPIILIILLFALVPIVGLIFLQVYLCKMDKDWPGLILPIFFGANSALFSLLLILGMVREGFLMLIIPLILINVPAIVFAMIYKSVHKKQVSAKEIDKMTIQDLG